MLLLLLLLWTSEPTEVEAAGRLDYSVSRCGVFGWHASENERLARFKLLVAEGTGQSREDVLEEFRRGVRFAYSREGEILETTTTPAGRARWVAETEARCDRIARDHPALLRRTPDTAGRWAQVFVEQAD